MNSLPEKDILFVSYIEQQIDQYVGILKIKLVVLFKWGFRIYSDFFKRTNKTWFYISNKNKKKIIIV